MRTAVFGSGGVGGYFGGTLAHAGEEVALIARGDHLRAIQENGLRVDSLKGDFLVRPTIATDDPAVVGVVDAIIVGVKAWQVSEAAEAMKPMVGPGTFVLPLENGVEAPPQLAAVLGDQHVLAGLTYITSWIAAPGHIHHQSSPPPQSGLPEIIFGELDNRPSKRAEGLRQALETAGTSAQIPPDIQVARWTKFMGIVAASGVGAVTRAPARVMRSVPQTRQLVVNVMREAWAVARVLGVALPDDLVEQHVARWDTTPPDTTYSLQRDIIAGRPSELESQVGAVVRLGAEAGVPTPVSTVIYRSLLPQEMRARGQVEFTV